MPMDFKDVVILSESAAADESKDPGALQSIDSAAGSSQEQPAEPEKEKNEHLELKYCEGCGALTLRPSTSAEIYCSRCVKKFAEIARQRESDRRAAAERRRS